MRFSHSIKWDFVLVVFSPELVGTDDTNLEAELTGWRADIVTVNSGS